MIRDIQKLKNDLVLELGVKLTEAMQKHVDQRYNALEKKIMQELDKKDVIVHKLVKDHIEKTIDKRLKK